MLLGRVVDFRDPPVGAAAVMKAELGGVEQRLERHRFARLHRDLTARGFEVWFDRVAMPSRGLWVRPVWSVQQGSPWQLVLLSWLNGSLTQPVEVTCVSCLEKFVHDINVPAFAVHTELQGPETVDLTPMIREDILLNLPAYPHCDREGGKKCKGPKVELTAAEKQDREAKREHDWGALDKLKLRK